MIKNLNLKQYQPNFAKKYAQGKGWSEVIIPNLLTLLPEKIDRMKLLDLGCGTGDLLFELKKAGKACEYTGIDLSKSMLKVARINNPEYKFICADVTEFSKKVSIKFDLIISIMVFCVLDTKEKLVSAFKEISSVLTKEGKAFIVVPHPISDPYIQSMSVSDYLNDGKSYNVVKKLENGEDLKFTDVHWSLSAYINSALNGGLKVGQIKELSPIKSNLPTYLLIELKK